jgi:hypothetical protein
MCRLGGQFAGVSGPGSTQAAGGSHRGPGSIDRTGINVAVYLMPQARCRYDLANLELVGQDRPGIVRHVAAALAARGVKWGPFPSAARAMSGNYYQLTPGFGCPTIAIWRFRTSSQSLRSVGRAQPRTPQDKRSPDEPIRCHSRRDFLNSPLPAPRAGCHGC